MLPALWVAKTGLSAQDTNLTTISNNLANVSTTGFKRDRAEFQDLLYQIKRQPGAQSTQDSELPSGLQLGTGVRIVGTQKNFTAGSLQTTDQPLDMAVERPRFLPDPQPDGTTSYTRDGTFHLDSNGQIVNLQRLSRWSLRSSFPTQRADLHRRRRRHRVDHCRPITRPPQVIGNLQTADFINPAGLQSVGGNLYLETAASGAPQVGTRA
jgi:flagellar basal-body rod protein FlgG